MKCPNCGFKVKGQNLYSNLNSGVDLSLPIDYHHIIFRSGTEKQFARYLILSNHLDFEYEPKRFKFPKDEVTEGPKSYLPDFYIPKYNVYCEVKGRLTEDDRARHRRFKKYYPDIELWAIISKKNKEAKLFYQILADRVFYIEDMK